MERAEILATVKRVLADRLGLGDVEEETHLFRELKLDSIQQLTFVVELEDHYRIRLDDTDEAGIETVGDVVDLVARKLDS